jgi:DNA-binding transcriptional ArsR family regulator
MLTGIRLKEKVKPFALRERAIAHPIRLSILYILAHGAYNLSDIALSIDYSPNLVAHHLKVLMRGGWVGKSKVAGTYLYTLNERMLFDFFRLFEGTALERNVIEKRLK